MPLGSLVMRSCKEGSRAGLGREGLSRPGLGLHWRIQALEDTGSACFPHAGALWYRDDSTGLASPSALMSLNYDVANSANSFMQVWESQQRSRPVLHWQPVSKDAPTALPTRAAQLPNPRPGGALTSGWRRRQRRGCTAPPFPPPRQAAGKCLQVCGGSRVQCTGRVAAGQQRGGRL